MPYIYFFSEPAHEVSSGIAILNELKLSEAFSKLEN